MATSRSAVADEVKPVARRHGALVADTLHFTCISPPRPMHSQDGTPGHPQSLRGGPQGPRDTQGARTAPTLRPVATSTSHSATRNSAPRLPAVCHSSPFPTSERSAAKYSAERAEGSVESESGTVRESDVVSGTMYLAKYGWTPKSALVVIVCAAFAAIGFFMWTDNLMIAGLTIVFFGGGGLVYAVGLMRGKLALRIDAEGITVGRSPLVRQLPGRTVPWSDVVSVVLFAQKTSNTTMIYLGVQRREGLAPLPGSPGAVAMKMSKALLPGIPADVLATSVPVNGWRLDEERLARTLALVAPSVPLLDVR